MHSVYLSGIGILLFVVNVSSQKNVSWNATLVPSYFSSLGYPIAYPNNHVTHWTITSENNMLVLVTILAGNIQSCCDYLLMKYGDEELGRFTGAVAGQARISPGNSMVVTFSSDQSIVKQGFFASYQSATCGQNLFANESQQQFSTPNWPENYPHNQDCFWIITSESNDIIGINIDEGVTEADHDFIQIYDSLSSVFRMSGTIKPRNYVAKSGIFEIHFHSNGENSENGINIGFQLATCGYNLTANSTSQIFPTLAFPRPFSALGSCEWYITALPDRKIFLIFLEGSTADSDCCDLVKVYDENIKVLQVSGRLTNSKYVLSRSNQLRVTFESDAAILEIGFRAMYEEVSCSFIFPVNKVPEATDVMMRSPKCLLILHQTGDKQIQFNLQSVSSSNYRYLEVYLYNQKPLAARMFLESGISEASRRAN